MPKYNVIFCYSVMHTGTHFMFNLLLSHDDVAGLYEIPRIYYYDDTKIWIQKKPEREQDFINNGKACVILRHVCHCDFDENILPTNRYGLLDSTFFNAYKTVIPVRDPLAALITWQNRVTKFHHRIAARIEAVDIEAFLRDLLFLPKLKKHGIGFHFPIDIPSSKIKVPRLFDYLGLMPDRGVTEYVAAWKKKNEISGDDNPLKAAYNRGDLEYLKANFPIIKNLIAHKHLLIQYLKGLGYEDLMWW